MAGLIAALFGGKSRPPEPTDPSPGIGGYSLPRGPAGQSGFPGSTSATRTFRGASPRVAKIEADTNTGFEQGLSAQDQIRQSAFRGDAPSRSPRSTPVVATPQPVLTQRLQGNDPSEFYGGPALKTGPGNDTAGANPLSEAQAAGGHSKRDTETPPTQRQPQIALDVPGAQNVRNTRAQDYKAVPGQMRAYRSASRPDQAKSGGISQPVTAESRFVFAGGGVQTYGMLRQMPYTGRGNGARGADLNGQRYYAEGQSDQFFNAGQGDYGIAREYGGKRPVGFTEPAPWTSNFYDTTDTVGTVDNPGTPTQAPDMVYVSPSTGRASNSTGRTG